jgi:hypothetical protein
MKTQSNNLLESLNSNDIKILTKEVKETVCSHFKKDRRKFSAAEYWDIQRRRRNLLVKRMAY